MRVSGNQGKFSGVASDDNIRSEEYGACLKSMDNFLEELSSLSDVEQAHLLRVLRQRVDIQKPSVEIDAEEAEFISDLFPDNDS